MSVHYHGNRRILVYTDSGILDQYLCKLHSHRSYVAQLSIRDCLKKTRKVACLDLLIKTNRLTAC